MFVFGLIINISLNNSQSKSNPFSKRIEKPLLWTINGLKIPIVNPLFIYYARINWSWSGQLFPTLPNTMHDHTTTKPILTTLRVNTWCVVANEHYSSWNCKWCVVSLFRHDRYWQVGTKFINLSDEWHFKRQLLKSIKHSKMYDAFLQINEQLKLSY